MLVFSNDLTRPELDVLGFAGHHVVVAHWEGGSARAFLAPGRPVTIGRADECELVVDDASVSRMHARLSVDEAGLLRVEDLGSTNGVTLMDAKLAKGETALVPRGAAVGVGASIITIKYPSAARPPTEPQPPTTSPLSALIERVAPSDITILILGETGVGKSVTAAELHRRSRRSDHSFLRLNCAGFPEALLEAELFGYERGAFTGAVQSKAGLLESADGGTVFLDEIGEMPLTTQAKLLSVLDTHEVQRLGSIKPKKIDVRFIAATNRDLPAEISAGRFRSDLYFRLSTVTLAVPPLRERPDSIVVLAHKLLADLAARAGKPTPRVADDVMAALVAHSWPGNVRELRNVLERALVMAGDGPILLAHVELVAQGSQPPPSQEPVPASRPSRPEGPLRDELGALERQRIVEALEACHGNQTRAAARLHISRRTLIYRMEAYGLPRPRKS